ncbi:putative late blight resistance protein homolog R1A-10 [Apium graveolens]|uniref:putative late blight resistance protein homolog R1A-10 n=1 Tax=Apium graveolens TaxID=4045 RepID=UPI003D7B5252
MGSRDVAGRETVVGFDDDARTLVEKLMGGKKQLQIISVVGMAGLGKTTLVKKVFDEPSIVYHFHVRAWTTVTQEPNKSDVLSGILKSGFDAGNENCSDMDLSVTLRQRLSGQRYLVVMDDIWDDKYWSDLMLCFPDDNVGSRIVITSRLADLPLHVHYQHPLRFLSEKESWDLLRYKVFLKESCPSSLIEIGAHIARKCQGLPLSIVVIAGILASDTTTNWWSQVAREMSSIASNAPEEYMETLVLSYNHLPHHLKPCFLYFAAFPEDYEIPEWKLVLLWLAEGFVKIQTSKTSMHNKGRNLEEVAADYLKDLISRSLVIVSKLRSDGGIRSCVVHDALRDLCIKIAYEENFLLQMPSYQHIVSKSETTTTSLSPGLI